MILKRSSLCVVLASLIMSFLAPQASLAYTVIYLKNNSDKDAYVSIATKFQGVVPPGALVQIKQQGVASADTGEHLYGGWEGSNGSFINVRIGHMTNFVNMQEAWGNERPLVWFGVGSPGNKPSRPKLTDDIPVISNSNPPDGSAEALPLGVKIATDPQSKTSAARIAGRWGGGGDDDLQVQEEGDVYGYPLSGVSDVQVRLLGTDLAGNALYLFENKQHILSIAKLIEGKREEDGSDYQELQAVTGRLHVTRKSPLGYTARRTQSGI